MCKKGMPRIGIIFCVCLLVIVEFLMLFLMYKSSNNKIYKLDNVVLTNSSSVEMFAIMLEQDDGTYAESSDSSWPTSGYVYNEEKSGCIDINGNKIESSISYDSSTNIASVNTEKTSYCYVYFNKE